MLWMIIITAEPPYWRRRWIFITLRPELGRRWTKNGIRWCAIMKRKSKTWLNVCKSPCSIITRGHCWLVVGNKTPTPWWRSAAATVVRSAPQSDPTVGALCTSEGQTLRLFPSFQRRTELREMLRRCWWIYLRSIIFLARSATRVLINKLIHRPTIGWPPATAGL